jgi:cytochrome c biogenesis protein CcmG/thiol:disulfide interchange protein DsbE
VGRQVYLSLLLCLLCLVPALRAFIWGFGHDPYEVPFVLQNKIAAPFSLTDINGKNWELQQWRGKPVVLHFWATWCTPCLWEYPALQRMAQEYADKAYFVGFIFQDDANQVKRYLTENTSIFPHLLDPDGRVAIEYGVSGVPETFILNHEGRIMAKHTGILSEERLKSTLNLLWAKSTSAKGS